MEKILTDNRVLFGVCYAVLIIGIGVLFIVISSSLRRIEQKVANIEQGTPLLPCGICRHDNSASGTCPSCLVMVNDTVDADECKWCHQRLRWPSE